MYAIVDIETTGIDFRKEKITEIAIYIHDGNNIIDEYNTLINPERNIPYQISRLTGITNEMVRDAPKFYEVAKKIVEITGDMIFVAHNVSFDYNFIRAEYKRLGYIYKRKFLCTVKMSRKAFPGKKSYSLGRICADLGIRINNRHRAAGDAFATVKLFERILQKDEGKTEAAYSEISKDHRHHLLHNLPEACGIYYFYDKNASLIYIGKSINIYKRVVSHLSNDNTIRALEMRSKISYIDYEITGSELIALLKESAEIKSKMPLYNRAQRRKMLNYGIFSGMDEKGYIILSVEKIGSKSEPLITFQSAVAARESLFSAVMNYRLCQKLCGLYKTSGACFHYSIKQCPGACIGQESTEDYNKRAMEFISTLEFSYQNFIVVDRGRDTGERSITAVVNGKFTGYTLLDVEIINRDTDFLLECIVKQEDNKDVRQIIKSYIRHNKVEKIIRF